MRKKKKKFLLINELRVKNRIGVITFLPIYPFPISLLLLSLSFPLAISSSLKRCVNGENQSNAQLAGFFHHCLSQGLSLKFQTGRMPPVLSRSRIGDKHWAVSLRTDVEYSGRWWEHFFSNKLTEVKYILMAFPSSRTQICIGRSWSGDRLCIQDEWS